MIRVRQPLVDTFNQITEYRMNIMARDQSNPEQTASITAYITVIRDRFAPRFVRLPYFNTLEETAAVGTLALNTTAVDDDLVERIEYRLMGDSRSDGIFSINSVTGEVRTQTSLFNDNLRLSSYTVRIVAFDTARPTRQTTATGTIQVNRNPNPPVFIPDSYTASINENRFVGSLVTTVTAEDKDIQDVISYEITGFTASSVVEQKPYFTIDYRTGVIRVAESNLNNNVNRFTLFVRACDDGIPRRCDNTTVTVVVTRFAATPAFEGIPYSFTIKETRQPSPEVLKTVQARDSDLQGTIVYAQGLPATPYFSVNPSTGNITLAASVILDTRLQITFRVVAYDDQDPTRRGTADVTAIILRNEGNPNFLEDRYFRTIQSNFVLGNVVINTTAVDSDGDKLRYSLLGNVNGLNLFSIDPDTGLIKLRQVLTNSNAGSYTLTAQVTDQRIPEKTDTAQVFITVEGDQFTPRFIGAPYQTSVPETRSVNTNIITVQGVDDDLKGRLQFVAVGIYPAPELFSVNIDTGAVTVSRDLKTTGLQDNVYTLSLEIYDTAYPDNRGRAALTINVLRNQGVPVFQPSSSYQETVLENAFVGFTVLQVTATDSDDGDVVTYDLVSSTNNGNDFFYIDPKTGEISTRRPLGQAPIDLYTFIVRASDNRGKTSQATVNIRITRLAVDSPPVFNQTPYRVRLTENQLNGSLVFTVTAVDNDLTPDGAVVYNLIGSLPGTDYFRLDPTTGRIFLQQPYINDQYRSLLYVLRVEAYDNLKPTVRVAENVLIEIDRNPNRPIFIPNNFYSTSIPETTAPGTNIINATATDNDNDVLSYVISNGGLNNAGRFFYVNPSTGDIFVKTNLRNNAVSFYTFSVGVFDNSFPEKSATANIQITVTRDTARPRFTGPDYSITIPETRPVDSIILRVNAIDDNLQGRIVYEVYGDGTAMAYFNVDSNTGDVTITKNLRQDSLKLYTLKVRAYDTFYPENFGLSTVTINVNRNPSAPVFTPSNEYQKTINEYTSSLSVLRVSASDADGDVVTYSMLGAVTDPHFAYFYILPSSGEIYLRQSVVGSTQNQYRFQVQASDRRLEEKTGLASVTIGITRNQSPVFTPSSSYSANIAEEFTTGQQMTTVSCIDRDLVGAIRYSVIGDAPAPSYFMVNPTTGVISPSTNLTVDRNLDYTLRVVCYDSNVPNVRATATVAIRVQRNNFAPQFQNEPYNRNLPVDTSVGSSIFRVSATDDDNDVLRYIQLADENSRYFYLSPTTGDIFLIRNLEETSTTRFTLNIRVTDQGIPERFDDSTVEINVSRQIQLPAFTNEPYSRNLPEITASGSSVFRVQAFDGDLRPGSFIAYEATGIYPAQSFFSVNRTTGVITLIQNLKNDIFITDPYRLTVIAYDNAVRNQQDTSTVTISVPRNPNGPIFNDNYETTIQDSHPYSSAVFNISASDLNGDAIFYSIVGNNIGRTLEFFTIDRNTGAIYVIRPLTESTPISRFTFAVQATDNGRPTRLAQVNVIININRNSPPSFSNTPYNVFIFETVANNTSIYRVSATDADARSPMVYQVVGTELASSFFGVRNNGEIYVRQMVLNDRGLRYVLRIRSYDPLTPNQYVEADVPINVERNRFGPSFVGTQFSENIPERTDPGTAVITVSATDGDNDVLVYSLTGDTRCRNYFYMTTMSSSIYLARSLLNTPDVSFTCQVSVTDNGYPQPKTADVTVLFTVTRGGVSPVFTQNARYFANINENAAVTSSIQSVIATRTGLQGNIVYESIGDYPALSFFAVNRSTGIVSITRDLRNDNLRLSTYTLRVKAYDSAASYLSATAEVFITVARNLNAPVFDRNVYRVTVREDVTVGTYIIRLNATDADGHRITCTMSGNQDVMNFFAIDADTCLISVKQFLRDTPSRNTLYTITVTATDNGVRQESANTLVEVTVLRDVSAPEFTNIPRTITLEETQATNTSIFTASGRDADLQGELRYALTGVFPASSYFRVNEVNGVITLVNSLLSDSGDSLSYTVRLQVYDTAYPDRRDQKDLTVLVNRNTNAPVFEPTRYERTISNDFTVGNSVLALTATERDNDKITFKHMGGTDDQKYFFLNPDSGVIRLRESLPDTITQYSFNVEAVDSRSTNIAKTATATVIINIRTTQAPVFQNLPYRFNVDVTQQVNGPVRSVLCTNNIPGSNIRYSLLGYAPGTTYFALNEVSGAITVIQSLPNLRDSLNIYNLQVSCYDLNQPNKVSTVIVQITVDRNLFTPRFEPTSYTNTIYNYEPVGYSVLQVTATDADTTVPENSILYSIASTSTTNGFFRIHPNTGEIIISRRLTEDNLNRRTFQFQVIAQDLGYPRKTSQAASVTITVLQNTADPSFNDLRYTVNVNEGIPVLQRFLQVRASDADPPASLNGQIMYSLSGVGVNLFQIDSTTGNISARVSLTTATQNEYTLTATASDKGTPSRSAQIPVVITITRAGNPYFEISDISVTINDDHAVNTQITQLQPRDPLSQTLVFEIAGDGDASTVFRVDRSTAQVTLGQSLLTTSQNNYVIRVRGYRVNDNTIQATAIVRVTVIRNRNAPRFLHSNLDITINEDQRFNVGLVDVNATDADTGANGELLYSINGPASVPDYSPTYFYINPVSGVISVIAPLRNDIRQPARYILRVMAMDNGSPSKTAAVNVTVNVNRNRNGPIFVRNDYNVTIDENRPVGTSIEQVTATEADNERVQYRMLPSLGALYFNINADTGIVSVRSRLTYDSTFTYQLLIQAVDVPAQTAVPRTATTTVIVNIIRNPNKPEFTVNPINITISEYLNVLTRVAEVRAVDADPSNTPSGNLTYDILRITSDTPSNFTLSNYFVISPTTGDVYVAQALIHDGVPDDFILTLRVRDGAVPPKSDIATMNIHLIRNINRPRFTSSEYTASIDNTWQVGRTLFTVEARDADTTVPLNQDTPNAIFDYEVDVKNEKARRFFGVNENGFVYVKDNLLLFDERSFFFYIIAIDQSWNPLSSRAPVYINITQIPIVNNTLGFVQPLRVINLDEADVAVPVEGKVIAVLNVVNNLNREVECRLDTVIPNNPFLVRPTADQKDCEVVLLRPLDRETVDSYNISVSVRFKDTTGRRKRQINVVSNSWQSMNIIINVRDMNDEAPMFVYPVTPNNLNIKVLLAAVPYEAQPQTDVATFLAVDNDSGPNGQVRYSMSERITPLTEIPFHVNPITGVMMTTRDFSSAPDNRQYMFTLTATDQPTNTSLAKSDSALVVVDLVEAKNIFILTIKDKTTNEIMPEKDNIKNMLQSITNHFIIIQKIRSRQYLTSSNMLDIDYDSTDIVFVAANTANYMLVENTELNLVTNPNSAASNNILNQLKQMSDLEIDVIKKPIDRSILTGYSDKFVGQTALTQKQKSFVWWQDNPWSALVAIAGLIIVLTIVALIVVNHKWRKYVDYIQRYKLYHASMSRPDFRDQPSFVRDYESQSLSLFLPPDENVQELGEINMNFDSAEPRPMPPPPLHERESVSNPVYSP
ncbi:protocadherin Fat 4 [Patella vulgata]|uniref:protocadherin Fat 4 n=1 Tax=Patella vulgata TaxID=6465 RepID=UPI0024A8ADD7|nr:protocadherin Fat 4 [Patella vulgata]